MNTINMWGKYQPANIDIDLANKTFFWQNGDNEKHYLKNELAQKFYSPSDILYTYNSRGFRSDELDNSAKIKILYSGCSITEGTGLPIEHVWSSFLNNRISDETGIPVKLFNIARSGIGIDSIVRRIYSHVEHGYFVPDMVCLLLPNVLRQEYLMVDQGQREPSFFDYLPAHCPPTMELVELHRSLTINDNYRQRLHDAFRNLLLLKWYLHSRNIPWFFSFWDDSLSKNVLDVNITTKEDLIYDIPRELEEHYVQGAMFFDTHIDDTKKNFEKLFKQPIARDYQHFGPNSHYNFSKEFYNQLITRESFQYLLEKWREI